MNLLFSNPTTKSGRNHMTIKMSFDDGLTWSIFDQILSNVYKIDLVDSFKQFNC
jgi:hypothetical protein